MPAHDDRSDAQLLLAAQQGDADAFGIFYERHLMPVKTYIRRRTGTAEDAADLVAETFAAALLSVHRGRASDVEHGGPWLTGIARNKLIDSYRSGEVSMSAMQRLSLERPPLDADDSPFEGVAPGLTAAINSLPPDERVALVERVLLEQDYDEMASDRGGNEAAIRKRVSRALWRLRQTIGAGQ